MARKNKTSQLRVRLTDEEREALEALVAKRGDSNISVTIRELLAPFLRPGTTTVAVALHADTHKNLMEMSKELSRDIANTISTCVDDVMLVVRNAKDRESLEVPLIAKELELRRSYKKPHDKAACVVCSGQNVEVKR